MPVMTFSPESAAKVSGRTNSCAAAVMTTCTLHSALLQVANDFGGFVGGDAATDAQYDFHVVPRPPAHDSEGKPYPSYSGDAKSRRKSRVRFDGEPHLPACSRLL